MPTFKFPFSIGQGKEKMEVSFYVPAETLEEAIAKLQKKYPSLSYMTPQEVKGLKEQPRLDNPAVTKTV